MKLTRSKERGAQATSAPSVNDIRITPVTGTKAGTTASDEARERRSRTVFFGSYLMFTVFFAATAALASYFACTSSTFHPGWAAMAVLMVATAIRTVYLLHQIATADACSHPLPQPPGD